MARPRIDSVNFIFYFYFNQLAQKEFLKVFHKKTSAILL